MGMLYISTILLLVVHGGSIVLADSRINLENSRTRSEIREIDANQVESWRDEILGFESPLIVRNVVDVLDSWTPKGISERHQGVNDLVVKYQYDTPIFSYYNKRPLAESNVRGTPAEPSFRVKTVSMSEFSRLETENYHYSSMPIEDLPSSLRQEIEQLHPVENIGEYDSMHLWMSSKNIVAYPHYDTSDNLFLQLRGLKRFYLASPDTTIRDLRLYPALHPRYRQIQDLKTFETTRMTVKTLRPGDLLVLPAYYLHKVEALNASTSINLWTESESFKISETLFQSALPFESEWSDPSIRSNAVILFLQEISRMLYNDETCSNENDVFVSLRNRYESAYHNHKVDINDEWRHCDSFDSMFQKETAHKIKQRAHDVHIKILMSIKSESVRFLYFANLIEFLVLWAVQGEARYVRSFLSSSSGCFQ
mgnify:CR=1 FL=1